MSLPPGVPTIPNSGTMWHENTLAGWTRHERSVKGHRPKVPPRSRPPHDSGHSPQGGTDAQPAGWLSAMPGYTAYSLHAREKQLPTPLPPTAPRPPLLPFIPQPPSRLALPASPNADRTAPRSPPPPSAPDIAGRLPDIAHAHPRREVGTRNGFNAFHASLNSLMECMLGETAAAQRERQGAGMELVLDSKMQQASVYLNRMDGVLNMAPDVSEALLNTLAVQHNEMRPSLSRVVSAMDIFLAYAMHGLTLKPDGVMRLREAVHDWLGVPPPAPAIVPSDSSTGPQRTFEIAGMVNTIDRRVVMYDRRLKGLDLVRNKFRGAHTRAAANVVRRKRDGICKAAARIVASNQQLYLGWVFEKWREVTKFTKVLRGLMGQLQEERAARNVVEQALEAGVGTGRAAQRHEEEVHALHEQMDEMGGILQQKDMAVQRAEGALGDARMEIRRLEAARAQEQEFWRTERAAMRAELDAQAARVAALEERLGTITQTLGAALPADVHAELQRERTTWGTDGKTAAPLPQPAPQPHRRSGFRAQPPPVQQRARVSVEDGNMFEHDLVATDAVDTRPDVLLQMAVEAGVVGDLRVTEDKLHEILQRAHSPLAAKVVLLSVLTKRVGAAGVLAELQNPPPVPPEALTTQAHLEAAIQAAVEKHVTPVDAGDDAGGDEPTENGETLAVDAGVVVLCTPEPAPSPPPPPLHPDVKAADLAMKISQDHHALARTLDTAVHELLWRPIVHDHDVFMHETASDAIAGWDEVKAQAAAAPAAIRAYIDPAVTKFLGLKLVKARFLTDVPHAAVAALKNKLTTCLLSVGEGLLDVYRYHQVGRREEYDVARTCRLEGMFDADGTSSSPRSAATTPKHAPQAVGPVVSASVTRRPTFLPPKEDNGLLSANSVPPAVDTAEVTAGNGTTVAAGLVLIGVDVGNTRAMTPMEFFLDVMLMGVRRFDAARVSTGDGNRSGEDQGGDDRQSLSAVIDLYITGLVALVKHMLRCLPSSGYSRIAGEATSPPVLAALRQHRSTLAPLYQRYVKLYPQHHTLAWRAFKKMMDDLYMPDERMTHYLLSQLFLKMTPYAHLGTTNASSLTFNEFETFICIIAMFKVPTPYVPMHVKVRKLMQDHILSAMAQRKQSGMRKSVA